MEDTGRQTENEPASPGLPHFPEVYRGNKTVVNHRKRTRGDDASLFTSTSSDPAVFSSDDDPALENVGRRKKRYVGSWFLQMPASSDSALGEDSEASAGSQRRRRRTLKRQFDSGVYMGDGAMVDSSDAEPDGFRPDEDESLATANSDPDPIPSDPPVPCRPGPLSGVDHRRRAVGRASKGRAAESEIQNYFQTLIEHGEDTVDLSSIGLRSISNATVSLLSGLARIPQVVEDVEFEQPETSISLIMSNNLLSRVPKAVFQLEHLTTLSLRANELVELPPSIARCRNLQSLNVSFNRLRYLPGELLDLARDDSASLRELVVSGNPFYQPKTGEKDDDDIPSSPGDSSPSRPCRTPVQYLDTAGTVYSSFRLDDGEFVDIEPDSQLSGPALPPRTTTISAAATRAPTLLELALCSAARASRDGVSLASHIGPDAPEHLRAMLDDAAVARYQGFPHCYACGRAFVRPRTRWLEFVGDDSDSTTRRPPDPLSQIRIVRAPFLRSGCSWACVPGVAEGGVSLASDL